LLTHTEKLVIVYLRLLQVLESYERAYSNMVRVQQLSELEEVRSQLSKIPSPGHPP